MYVCGKDPKNTGKFQYELYTGFNEHVETVGNFDNKQEAEKAAQAANRALILSPGSFVPASGDIMSVDDIFSELEA